MQSSSMPELPSRRQLREAEQGPRRAQRPPRVVERTPSRHRWVPRAAVLGTLAVATIAMPLSAGAQERLGAAGPYEPEDTTGPGTLDVISAQPELPPISQAVAAAAGTSRTEVTSRAADRGPLPDCDSSVRPTGTNGNLNEHELCQLWQPGESLRPDAATALSELNEAFNTQFGRDLCLVASYRTLSTQVSLKSTRGGFAAVPGTSNHGWGLAIDLCSKETGSKEVYAWLNANGSTYGWENPSWAKRGGGGHFEPWHFEFTKGVDEATAKHGS